MNQLMTLFIVTIALVSCNNSNQKSMSATDSEKIVRQYFEHFNNHDWTSMAKMYTETAEFKDPSLGPGLVKQTRQQIIEKYSGLCEIFPDIKDSVLQIYSSGNNHIIVEFVSSGTALDSTQFELPICTIFTIENGLISKDFTYFDNFAEGHDEHKK